MEITDPRDAMILRACIEITFAIFPLLNNRVVEVGDEVFMRGHRMYMDMLPIFEPYLNECVKNGTQEDLDFFNMLTTAMIRAGEARELFQAICGKMEDN